MTTLRRELRTIIMDAIREEWVDISMHEGQVHFSEWLADKILAMRAFAELPQLSDNPEPNVELFRGDPTDYPEHLRETALCLRDVWRFSLPQKPRKKEKKGQYAFWIMSMDDLKQACGEHGTKVLEVLHKEYVEYAKSHGGTWPHSVAGPQSLVNVARGRAAQMRTQTIEFVVQPKSTRRPEDEEGEWVPAPERR
jgi:hypothetical protein